MTMLAKVFQNGRSQAVRLPKECRFDTDEVYVEKVGDSLVMTPKEKNKWDIMRNALDDMEEFEFQRDQPPIQERDLF